MPGQHVHDGAGPRPVQQVEGQVIHQAVGRPGQQEPAVRERRPETRAEPAVGQRKRPGQPVVKGQILVRPVGHGRGLVALGRGLLSRGHETVHLAGGPLRVAGAPALAGHAVLLHGGARVIGPDHRPCGVRILGIRRAIVTERESLPPAEGAEVVVEGVVLHHQDDDVLDLRQHVGASRTGGIGSVARPVPAYPPLPPAQFLAFDPLPGAHAGHISSSSAACFAHGHRVGRRRGATPRFTCQTAATAGVTAATASSTAAGLGPVAGRPWAAEDVGSL